MRRNRIAARARRTLRCLAASLAAVACLLALAGQARAAELRHGWWLQIKSAACAQGPKVLLGDIAQPQGELSQEAWKEMAQRPLWSAPERVGNQTALSRERLLALLRHHAEDLAEACALPAQLVVQRGGVVLGPADIERRIVEYLTDRSAELGGELEIKDMHAPPAIFLAHARDRLELLAAGPLKPGRINMLFEVRGSGGKVLRRYAASAFANVWKALPCAMRPLNRLQPVDLANIQFKRKNLAHNPNAWDGSGGPWRMVRSVGVDQAITMADIEPVPVIARGDKVSLVFEGANLRLHVKAEALADGGVGQAIEVRNLQSNRKVLATVRDSATVVVR